MPTPNPPTYPFYAVDSDDAMTGKGGERRTYWSHSGREATGVKRSGSTERQEPLKEQCRGEKGTDDEQ